MSLRVTTDHPYLLLQWAAVRLGLPNGMWMEGSRAIGVMDDENRIRAVAVFNKFCGEGCEGSLVSDGTKSWLTPGIMAELLSHPFDAYGMPRVAITLRESDTDTQILALKAGFRFEARLRAAALGAEDGILFSMLRHEADILYRTPPEAGENDDTEG